MVGVGFFDVHLGLSPYPKPNRLKGCEECCFADPCHLLVFCAGDIGTLHAKRLKKVDLSKSKVSGDINSLKNAYVLSYLDISGTSIGGSLSAWQLNRLETFKASRCHLDGAFVGSFFESLVTVDLSSTQISRVESIPSKCRTLLLAHIGSMSFAPGLLRNAAKNYVFVDLRNVTFTNQSEPWSLSDRFFYSLLFGLQLQQRMTKDAQALLDSGAVTRSSVRTSFHNSRGFACFSDAHTGHVCHEFLEATTSSTHPYKYRRRSSHQNGFALVCRVGT